MTNKADTKPTSSVECAEFLGSGRLLPTLLLSASMAFAAAAGADSMMKDSAMKTGEGMMEKTEMKDEKMMMKDDKGMMQEGKEMMKDDKGMMQDDKAMMTDSKEMMKDDKGMMEEPMKK